MEFTENTEKGLYAKRLDSDNILQFGRMKYNAKYGYFVSDSCLSLEDFVSYPTKKEATIAARKMKWPLSHVEKIGSRFWSAWGIRHDFRDDYFLASYE